MSTVVMNYSPNDFFYVKFDNENETSTINNSICAPLKPYDNWDNSCNIANYNNSSNNKIDCNLKELCKNKEKAEYLQSIQNTHNGSDQNYLDTKASYNTSLLRTFNLGIGIFIIIGLIYRNRNI
jgi:hypothetical protein